jgi:hypothetical protein
MVTEWAVNTSDTTKNVPTDGPRFRIDSLSSSRDGNVIKNNFPTLMKNFIGNASMYHVGYTTVL